MRKNIFKIIIIFAISFLLISTSFLTISQKIFGLSKSNIISGKTDLQINTIDKGTIFYVGGDGPNNYTSIQQAIDNTSNGDTVYIYNNSSPYCENIQITSSISLIGENRESTIIDACGYNNVVQIYANNTLIQNLCIKNGSCTGVGIKIQSFINLTVDTCNIIQNNHAGISLLTSSNNQIKNCNIYNNIMGILIDQSTDNIITNNNIYDNNFGIEIYGTSNNNNFYHNAFFKNNVNAYDPGNNLWDDGYLSGGNYWDDYEGDDFFNGPNQDIPGSDHIGDIPYEISPGNNFDYYPLIAPFGPPYADYNYYVSDKTIFLNGSLSFDYDGIIISYDWDLDDGNLKNGETINHTYNEYGLYDVLLTVTDDEGKIGECIKTVIVDNEPPVIIDHTPTEGSAGSPFVFNVTVNDILVSYVYVIYWYDEGFPTNLSMENLGGDIWQKTININMTSESLFYDITAVDGAGNFANTGIKEVTIIPDYPPNKPSNPNPIDGTKGVELEIDLNWNGGDPDFDDNVWYDLYFGDTNPPQFLKTIGPYPSEQISISCDIEKLDYGITYFWKVIAQDNHGLNSTPPADIWSFTTTKIGIQIIQPNAALVYGAVDITAEVNGPGEVEKVEFMIDNKTQFTDYDAPYVFSWNPIICFKTNPISFNRNIKVVAYDKDGDVASDEISVFKWRFHPFIILATLLLIIRFASKLRGGFSPLK